MSGEKSNNVLEFHSGKEVSKSEATLIQGITHLDEKDNPVMGYFYATLDNCQVCIGHISHIAVNRAVVLKSPHYYEGIDGIIYYKPLTDITKSISLLGVSDSYKKSQDYSVTSATIAEVTKYLENRKIDISSSAKDICKELKGLSVGVELETATGIIPQDVLASTGLVPLRDGSISGLEYVTIPLSTEKDCQILINSLHAVETYTATDGACALHFHFGNIPRTEEFIVAMYHTIAVIQNELYALQPPYKMLNWGVKRKSYSQPLPMAVTGKLNDHNSVVENFEYIYEWLTMGMQRYDQVKRDLNNVKSHPADPSGQHKWNISPRYSIVNFVPLIFGNKKTIEFRLSEISVSRSVVIGEMLLFANIVNYVKANSANIIKNLKRNNLINLEQILSSTTNKFGDFLEYMGSKRNRIGTMYKSGKVFMDFGNSVYNMIGSMNTVQGEIIDQNVEIEYVKNNLKKYSLKKFKTGYPSFDIPSAIRNNPTFHTHLAPFSDINVSLQYRNMYQAFSALNARVTHRTASNTQTRRLLTPTEMRMIETGFTNQEFITALEVLYSKMGNFSRFSIAIRNSYLRLRESVASLYPPQTATLVLQETAFDGAVRQLTLQRFDENNQVIDSIDAGSIINSQTAFFELLGIIIETMEIDPQDISRIGLGRLGLRNMEHPLYGASIQNSTRLLFNEIGVLMLTNTPNLEDDYATWVFALTEDMSNNVLRGRLHVKTLYKLLSSIVSLTSTSTVIRTTLEREQLRTVFERDNNTDAFAQAVRIGTIGDAPTENLNFLPNTDDNVGW